MIPVLWLTGPPGVGKTAVAGEIYQRLQRAGDDVAYLDVDQLGICHPPPAGDPDRHGLKARNVAALRANFAAAGARILIVSGVVDAERGPDIDAIGGPPTAIVRLRADPDELRARLRRRDGASAQHEAALEARAFDGSGFADRCVDTTGLSIGEAASRVLGEIGDWPPVGHEAAGAASSSAAGGEMLWVSGTTGVGKSTVAFRAYLDVLGLGRPAAYIDINQLGFCSPAPDDASLRARNLAALWTNFHAVGARLAIVTGCVSSRAEALLYEQALPGVRLSWRRLRVGDAELVRRILSRGEGGSWAEPGDPLKGRPRDELFAVGDQAIAAGHRLDQEGVGPAVDIDGLGVESAAAALLRDWPTRA
jgi:adenylylsulfate kinase-like enzyme